MTTKAGMTKPDEPDQMLGRSREEAHSQLHYLADMLQELQDMCGLSGGPTLKGLLALARAEALMEAKRLTEPNS